MARAGRYIRQPSGYKAFIPEPLPPRDPPIRIDRNMQVLLSRADRALGELSGSVSTLPDPDLFVFMYVRKEAVLSSQIEGTQSSLTHLLEAEADVLDPDRPRDVIEVLNYVRAMKHGLERLDQQPVSVRLIREIHARLLQGVRGQEHQPGDLRRSQNWIGASGATLREAIFVPPPPHLVGELLGQWERFVNDDSDLPRLIKIGLAHAQFETIHPFLDGNGRIGRLLITFLLTESGDLNQPVLYLSHYFKQHRQRYYELLQATRDQGDWEAWLQFFIHGVDEVSREARDTSRHIVLLRERHRQTIVDSFGRTAGNGLRVLERLFSQPVISVSTIGDLTGLSYPAANNLMSRFAQSGILRESTGHARNRRFEYSAYIDLFAEDRKP